MHVCPFISRYCLLSPPRCFPGQAHLQHYTKSSTEPLIATFSALQGTILPLGQGSFTHNTVCSSSLHVTNPDLLNDNQPRQCRRIWDKQYGEGGGDARRMRGTQTGPCSYGARFAYNVRVTYLLISFLILMMWQMTQTLLYTLAAEDTRRPASIRAPCLFFYHQRLPPRRARQHSSTCFPIRPHARPLDQRPHLVPVGWDSWGKIIVVHDGLDAKARGEEWGALSIVRCRN